jgi:hypothetical protein
MEGLAGDMGEKIMREARAQQAELDQEEGGFHMAQGRGFHSEVRLAPLSRAFTTRRLPKKDREERLWAGKGRREGEKEGGNVARPD